MKHTNWRWAIPLVVLLAGLTPAALPQRGGGAPSPAETRLPNGRLQSDAIAKAEYEANLKDAAALSDLARDLRLDLEKSDRYVLSIATIKKTDEIEKLAKRIRGRLRRN